MKGERNTVQMKEKFRNTQVQINDKYIDKLSQKGTQNNDSKDDPMT